MHRKFLSILIDPLTGEQLMLRAKTMDGDRIIEGELVARDKRYPIVRGIPRFVTSDAYAKTFSWQWKRWPRVQFESENVGGPMEGHTRRMWERITGCNGEGMKQKMVLEIGCGSGRFVDVARAKNHVVVGVDYSNAIDAAGDNFKVDDNVLLVQADALRLPFKSGTFDAAFSIGVLHHTPSPPDGVKEAFRVVRNDGEFAMAVYGKGGFYDFPSVQLWRKLFQITWPIFGHYPPLIYSYLTISLLRPIARVFRPLGLALRAFFPFVNLPDKRWSLLDTFDSVTPAYQSAHESYEVWGWFKEAGFREVEPTDWGFTSYKGKK